MSPIMFMFILSLADGYLNNGLLSISITRHHKGDIFIAQGKTCYEEFCVVLSGGTAISTGKGECECKCAPNRPVFRDDLNICVSDIQECSLVPFASSSTIKKIPYVFLPLKGQIVYPSAEIIISETETPVCVVSGGQFLGQSGWLNLRNNSATEPPFRLFRDEGRTYLQWLGESSLRMAMEGRIILVHLMCKDASITEEPKIFTPCIAFRVAGNPSIREVMFATDVHLKEEYSGSLKMRDYVAIGTCSLLLALVYISAVFLYLHIRRKKQKTGNKKIGGEAELTLGEEGVVKNNPLLQASRHMMQNGQENAGFISDSNSCCSDLDQTSDLLCLDDDDVLRPQNLQTSAIIHPCELDYAETILNQDSNNIEKLPEENVSIVETLEAKDEHTDTVKGMGCPNGRRKLYFNPSYFEPDLLKAPPPAAVEFLTKIREVIAIAKHKMTAKKFSPSLLGIPEEDGSSKTGYGSVLSLKKSPPSEKSETKKNTKTDVQKPQSNFHLVPNDLYCPSDTKQKIIRKWLEDVPVMILQTEGRKSPRQKIISEDNKILNKSKLWELNDANGNRSITPTEKQEKKKPSTKGRAPPLPTVLKSDSKIEKGESVKGDSEDQKDNPKVIPPRPPPLPTFNFENEIPRVQGKDFVPPSVTRNLMDAVIQELTCYKNHKIAKDTRKESINNETDQDSQKNENDGTNTTNTPQTKEVRPQDDHEYEIILLNADPPQNEDKDIKIYNLPEILSKNDRTEGYSLVSEVYVNDGYSYCSSESSPSSYSTLSAESETVHYDTPVDRSGRLTIHVNDSPDRYKTATTESDSFEPDTLDRKPRKTKLVKKINETDNCDEYCNQKFHKECSLNSNEQFTDSLERPKIMLRTSGTFKRNLEKDIDNLFNSHDWNRTETVGSLREIYEAKSKNFKIETRSLIDTTSNHDHMSTLSYSEDRKNKLLHHGIVLHIQESSKRRRRSSPKVLPRPLKPTSRSGSPAMRSNCTSPPFTVSPRSTSPPVPPPRSIPTSSPPRFVYSPPPPPRSVSTPTPPLRSASSPSPPLRSVSSPPPPPRSINSPPPPPRSVNSSPPPPPSRSTNSSPISLDHLLCISPNRSPNNSLHKSHKNGISAPNSHIFQVPSSSTTPPPPRPPKPMTQKSPFLPQRNKPPLPPKNIKKQFKPTPKFAGRPLPPLPRSHLASSPYKDLETLSTTSMDSLNSSEYEAFYTLPYEESDETGSVKPTPPNNKSIRSFSSAKEKRNGHQREEKKSGNNKSNSNGPGDSGYLSTDSNDSYCHNQMLFSTHFARISENGSQNSETEESLCDGASESGGESIATDSFFYGNFKKNGKSESSKNSDGYPYSLRLSDVEVNSDTERHCVPIMVRP